MDGDRFRGLLGDLGADPPSSRRRAVRGEAAAPPARGYPGQPAGYPVHPEAYANQQGGWPEPPGGYPEQPGGYPEPRGWAGDTGAAFPPGGDDPASAAGSGGAGYGGDPGGVGGGGRGGPSVKLVAATLGVTALVAALAGGVYGMLRPASQTVTTTPAASSTTSPSRTAAATTKAATTTAKPATSSATPTPRETAFVEDPTSVRGMDFGILKAVARSGGRVVLRVDRASFLTGAKAQAYYAEHPDVEPLDYAVVNTNARVRTFTLADGAVIYAQYALGDGNTVKTESINADQLFERAKPLLASGDGLLLWLRHTKGPDGPVYYVAEQYVP